MDVEREGPYCHGLAVTHAIGQRSWDEGADGKLEVYSSTLKN